MANDPQLIVNQRENLIGQLAYVECRLLTNLEAWERREYQALKKDYELKIAGLNCAIAFLNGE